MVGRCNYVCEKFCLRELVNLLWLRNINKEGMAMLGMNYYRNVWKKTFVERIQEYGRRWRRDGFGMIDRIQIASLWWSTGGIHRQRFVRWFSVRPPVATP